MRVKERADSRSLSERFGPLLAAGGAFLAHVASLGGGFVWLDHAHIEEGLALLPPSRWASAFTQGFAGTSFYRPLMTLSLSLDAALGFQAFGFRLVTLGWHALAAGLLVVVGRALGLSARIALAAGLLFAVHPATSLVASAVAFRSEAMTLSFLLLLVLGHERGSAVGAAGAIVGAAFSKETGWLLAPLFVAALMLRSWQVGQRFKSRLLAAETFAFAACSGLRLAFAPSLRAACPEFSVDEAVATRLGALAKGFWSWVWPFERGICDAFAVTGFASVWPWLGLLGAFGIALWCRRAGTVAWLFALALLPALQLVPVMRWWSPHYFYVALAFGTLLFAQALTRVANFRLALGVLLVSCSLLSLTEARRYRSDVSLWAPEVAREAECREGQFYLGEVARSERRWDDAAARYRRAATNTEGYLAYVDEAAALQNLGAVELAAGRGDRARSAWERALSLSINGHGRARLRHNLASLALQRHDSKGALAVLDASEQALLPESALLRAKALHDLGREAEAQSIIRELAAQSHLHSTSPSVASIN